MSIADKLTTVAENVPKVYEQGKKAQEKEFWEEYLRNGYDMSGMFSGGGWKADNFKPTKKMYPWSAARMFCLFDAGKHCAALDMVTHLEKLGVELDFSRCVSMDSCFSGANICRLGVIDIRKSPLSYYGIFASDKLVTVDELKVAENIKYSALFNGATALENLTITGTIGQNGFSVAQSTKLSKISITSIINALSQTTSGLTVTLSKTAVNNAFGINIDDPTTWAEGTEYYELRHSRDNWTITYV